MINELVLLITTYDKEIYDVVGQTTYYLPHVNIWNHPHHNALPTTLFETNEQNTNDYQRTEAGISRQVTDGSTDIDLGRYFHEKMDIKPLLPYEGDMILEGRFGNSIRLGSTVKEQKDEKLIPKENQNNWSDSEEGTTGDPIIIIRNGQTVETEDKGWIHTTEKIDTDDSSIYLTSTQKLTNFIVASDNDQSYHAKPTEPI